MDEIQCVLNRTLVLGDNQEENDFEIQRHINIAAAEIHKRTLRNAQFVLFEGPIARDWVKRHARENTINNRFYAIPIGYDDHNEYYTDCIVLIRRGEWMRLWREECPDDSIPEIKRRPAASREKDFVYTIYLERKPQ